MAAINRDFFFAQARKTLFSGKFTQPQVRRNQRHPGQLGSQTYSDQDDQLVGVRPEPDHFSMGKPP